MNLAWKDIRRQWPRFIATAVGLGLLYAIVLAMGGIYRGMVTDAVVLIDATGADLWLVQRDTQGPFAERSTVSPSLELRARAVPGVEWARSFVTATIQREHQGRALRATLVGLAWPDDRGDSIPLVAGRTLRRAHRELVADRSLGLGLGEVVPLGDETYTVVGLAAGMVGSGGDPLLFGTVSDVSRIQAYEAPEALRLRRATSSEGRLDASLVSAVLVRVAPGEDVLEVRRRVASWPDVSVTTQEEQRALLLGGVIDKARRQIGLFRGLLAIVSSIIVSLVVFNMTVAKTHEIALLKLMGAKLSVIVGMIVQQSLLLGLLGYAVALGIAEVAFPYFPRRVVVGPAEYAGVLVLVLVIGLLASAAAVRRALSIPATTILAG